MKHKINIRTFMFFLQRTIKSYNLREFISKTYAKKIGKIAIGGDSSLINDFENIHIKELRVNGFTELDKKLDINIIDEIIKRSNDLQLLDPFNRSFGRFAISDIPDATHVANFKREDLIGIDSIMELANDPGVLRIVQEFLGAKPTISNVNMWWSIAGKEKAKDAQLFHRDVDDLKFCKLFVYLTDVGMNDGPHTYVKGSSATNKLTKIRRYQDDEIVSAFGEENVTNFCRPKGSIFIVDTYGFHKGTLPIDNNRLLLQIQYSLNPIGIESYNPISIKYSYEKYINRLLIK